MHSSHFRSRENENEFGYFLKMKKLRKVSPFEVVGWLVYLSIVKDVQFSFQMQITCRRCRPHFPPLIQLSNNCGGCCCDCCCIREWSLSQVKSSQVAVILLPRIFSMTTITVLRWATERIPRILNNHRQWIDEKKPNNVQSNTFNECNVGFNHDPN